MGIEIGAKNKQNPSQTSTMFKTETLPVRELNLGLPRDRRGTTNFIV